MVLSRALIPLLSVSLVAAPAAAAPAPRAPAPVTASEGLHMSSEVIALVFLVVIGIIIWRISDIDKDPGPLSP